MPPYRIAIFYEAVQLTDVFGVDLFGNCSKAYVDKASTALALPPAVISQAIEMEFLWVSSTMEPAKATPDTRIVPTHTYETCPRDVDVLLVGGPLLTHRPPASLTLMREIFEEGKGKKGVVLMTTCVGSLWAADAGVLKGKRVTTNRMALEIARSFHKDVEWEDRRWVIDEVEGKGEIWTSGGAACGIDMVAAFLEARFPKQLAINARIGLDVDPHVLGQDYSKPWKETLELFA